MADKLDFCKGDTVGFKKFYLPSHGYKKRVYVELSIPFKTGMLIGKTVRYEGKIKTGGYEEPSEFIPEKSITFWIVEPDNNNRYLKPYLVKEEDLILPVVKAL